MKPTFEYNSSASTVSEYTSASGLRSRVNPGWKAAYASLNVTFVDVTATFGVDTPLTQLVKSSTHV